MTRETFRRKNRAHFATEVHARRVGRCVAHRDRRAQHRKHGEHRGRPKHPTSITHGSRSRKCHLWVVAKPQDLAARACTVDSGNNRTQNKPRSQDSDWRMRRCVHTLHQTHSLRTTPASQQNPEVDRVHVSISIDVADGTTAPVVQHDREVGAAHAAVEIEVARGALA